MDNQLEIFKLMLDEGKFRIVLRYRRMEQLTEKYLADVIAQHPQAGFVIDQLTAARNAFRSIVRFIENQDAERLCIRTGLGSIHEAVSVVPTVRRAAAKSTRRNKPKTTPAPPPPPADPAPAYIICPKCGVPVKQEDRIKHREVCMDTKFRE